MRFVAHVTEILACPSGSSFENLRRNGESYLVLLPRALPLPDLDAGEALEGAGDGAVVGDDDAEAACGAGGRFVVAVGGDDDLALHEEGLDLARGDDGGEAVAAAQSDDLLQNVFVDSGVEDEAGFCQDVPEEDAAIAAWRDLVVAAAPAGDSLDLVLLETR